MWKSLVTKLQTRAEFDDVSVRFWWQKTTLRYLTTLKINVTVTTWKSELTFFNVCYNKRFSSNFRNRIVIIKEVFLQFQEQSTLSHRMSTNMYAMTAPTSKLSQRSEIKPIQAARLETYRLPQSHCFLLSLSLVFHKLLESDEAGLVQ